MNHTAFISFLKKTKYVIQRQLLHSLRPFLSLDDILSEFSEKPAGISFEVTNICNANCIFCGYQYLERSKTILPMDLFKKAIDEYSEIGGGNVGFTPVVGDSFLDPHFLDKIRYARGKKNIRQIGFYTNGILINKIGARDIISSGVTELTISIGGFDAESYARIFQVDRWDSVYEGLLNLLKENESAHEKVDIWIELRSDIPVWKLIKTTAFKELTRYHFNFRFNTFYDNWNNRISKEDLKGTMRLRRPAKKTEPCFVLYTGIKILSNGNATLCGCRDLNGDSELVLGNIQNRSILDMWRDPSVEKIRSGFYRSTYPKICHDCSFYRGLSIFRREKAKKLLKLRKKFESIDLKQV